MFLFKKYAAVIEFGSVKLTVTAAKPGRGGERAIAARACAFYDGYYNGRNFGCDVKELKEAVKKVIEDAQRTAGFKIKEFYVGVPTVFTAVVNNNAQLRFGGRRKLRESDLENLRDMAETFGDEMKDFMLIDSMCRGLYSEGRRLRSMDEAEVSDVRAEYTFLFADRYFYDTVKAVFKELGLGIKRFLSEDKVQVQLCMSQQQRRAGSILLDCGALTTNVAVCEGAGFSTVDMIGNGGEYLTGMLSDELGIEYEQADEIKRKINLNLSCTDDDVYKAGDVAVSALKVNSLTAMWINELANSVYGVFQPFIDNFNENTVIVVTGGGLAHIIGGMERLSDELGGIAVRVATELSSESCSPEDIASNALINAAYVDMF